MADKCYTLKDAKKNIKQLKGCIEKRFELTEKIYELVEIKEKLSENYFYPFFNDSNQIIMFNIFMKKPDTIFTNWCLLEHKGHVVLSNVVWERGIKKNVKRLIDMGIIKRVSPGKFKLAPAFKKIARKYNTILQED